MAKVSWVGLPRPILRAPWYDAGSYSIVARPSLLGGAPSDSRPSVVSSICIVGHLVDRNGDREDETVIFARDGLDAVGVAQREPVLRYAGDRFVSAVELVLVAQDIPWATMSWPPSTIFSFPLRSLVTRSV